MNGSLHQAMFEEGTWLIEANLRRDANDSCGGGRGSELPSLTSTVRIRMSL